MDGQRLTSPQIPQLARSAPSLGMIHALGTDSVSFRREAPGLIFIPSEVPNLIVIPSGAYPLPVIPSERSESRDLWKSQTRVDSFPHRSLDSLAPLVRSG